jgi:hypothetical protein
MATTAINVYASSYVYTMDPETGWRSELALSIESVFDVADAMGYPVVLECMKDQKLKSTLTIHDKTGTRLHPSQRVSIRKLWNYIFSGASIPSRLSAFLMVVATAWVSARRRGASGVPKTCSCAYQLL